jgi:hypothetical protein
MTKLSRVVIACLSATVILTSGARANSFFYLLDNNTLADANGGPSLVSYGGTLNQGYTFGVLQGLSLSGTGIFDVYSIDIHFYFDNVNASFNGYQRILDFKNREFDEGLYSRNGRLEFFVGCCSGPGGTGGSSAGPVFPSGQLVDLLVTRSATGVFSAYVNGNLALSFLDSTGLATFSGPDNVIYFFMDDFESLQNFPTLPEAGSGFVDFIQVTTPAATVPGPIVGAGLPGLILASGGLLGWWRRRRRRGLRATCSGVSATLIQVSGVKVRPACFSM